MWPEQTAPAEKIRPYMRGSVQSLSNGKTRKIKPP